MKRGFVKTENFKRLSEAQKQVEKRGAREASLVLVQGRYGIGKSELTERWAADSGWVFVRAKSTWTKRAMLDELAELDWQRVAEGSTARLGDLRQLSVPRVKNLLRHRLRLLGWQVPVASRLDEFVRQVLTAGPDRHPELVLPDGKMRVAQRRLHWLSVK